MPQATVKSELIWWTSLTLLSTLIIGVVTGFRFHTLDIQLHDTYYVLGSFDCIKMLAVLLILSRGFYLLTDILTDRYLILAFTVSIVNAIAGLFIIIATYLVIQAIMTIRTMNPQGDLSTYFLLSAILMGIFTTQAIVEIRMIRKLRGLLARR